MRKEVKMKKAPFGITRVRLVQAVGILVILFGLLLGTVGVNKAAGGTTTIIIDLRPLLIVEVDQVLGLVFSMVGIVAWLVGSLYVILVSNSGGSMLYA